MRRSARAGGRSARVRRRGGYRVAEPAEQEQQGTSLGQGKGESAHETIRWPSEESVKNRSSRPGHRDGGARGGSPLAGGGGEGHRTAIGDRQSTRLTSSH